MPSGSLTITSIDYVSISVISSILALTTVIIWSKLLCLIKVIAISAISLASIAQTFFAPAYAAKIDKIPDPHPTSITILSLKSIAFLIIPSRYVLVRILS